MRFNGKLVSRIRVGVGVIVESFERLMTRFQMFKRYFFLFMVGERLIMEYYEMAGRMKDLELGSTHLIPVEDDKRFLALLIAQKRPRGGFPELKYEALEECFKKLSGFLSRCDHVAVHLPRIGQGQRDGGDWYSIERLVRKWFPGRGVPTFIYYFPRRART